MSLMQEANTQASVRPGKLRRLLVLLLLVGILWGCVIVYWVVRQSVPDARQMVFGLGVIPGVVILFWFVVDILKGLLDSRQKQQIVPIKEQAADPIVPVQLGELDVLSTSCCLPADLHSGSPLPDSLLAIPRPALHPSLRDAEGMPLRLAWVELEGEEGAGEGLADYEARILALFERVMDELVPQLNKLADQAQDSVDAQVVAGLRRVETVKTVPGIRIRIYLAEGASLSLEQRILGLTREKLDDWGVGEAIGALDLVRQANANQVWRDLEALSCGQHERMPIEVLMAAESQISDHLLKSTIYRQMQQDRHDDGCVVPGEGAAGVIFLHSPRQTEGPCPSVRLFGPVGTQVDGRMMMQAKIAEMVNLIQRLTRDEPVLADDLSLAAIHDANMGSMLAVEAIQALASGLPGLNHVKQVLALSAHVGKLGPVAPLAQIAVAATQMHYSPNPMILLSLDDKGARFAMALRAIDEDGMAQKQSQSSQSAQ